MTLILILLKFVVFGIVMSKTPVDLNKLADLSKAELMSRVKQLEAHVAQLRNILAKQNDGKAGQSARLTTAEAAELVHSQSQSKTMETKKQRHFDFKRYNKRHVALKVCYLGWDYQGLAVQEDAAMTIERELFAALKITRLVESRETSNYHRCGRTDKGVSAFGQVISLDLRTNLLEGPGVIVPEGSLAHERCGDVIEEIRYAHILNNVLPTEIRILAWAAVETEFSARFNCMQRTYKYYFPAGDLNVELMHEVGQQFVGRHDFRNFCKMDVGNGVVNYIRCVRSVNIRALKATEDSDGYRMFELTVVGQAFLWHQIRCMVAVLFLIGQDLESSDIIRQLLDVESSPCKPQYCMAAEYPLVLFDCEYEGISWKYEEEALVSVMRNLQENWTKHAVKAEIIRQMLRGFELQPNSDFRIVKHQNRCLVQGWKAKAYKPLLSRPVCGSLEDRVAHYKKKRKFTQNGGDDDKLVT